MELEFDKEIDALLRKTATRPPVNTGASIGGHLDADELAAFAENAVPGPSRQMYLTHLADCDRCRKMLSTFISINTEAASEAAIAAARVPIVAVDIPWYKRLFAMPNLAYTMGGLVVLFTGIIGLLVWQSGRMGPDADLSRVTDSRPMVTASDQRTTASSSNSTAANTAANVNSSSSVESVTKSGVAVGTANAAGTADQEAPATLAEVAKNEPSVPAAAAAPPTKEVVIAQTERDVRPEKAKEENKVSIDGVRAEDTRNRPDNQRNVAELAPNTRSAKDLKLEGPRQVQSQTQAQGAGLPQARAKVFTALRSAGGKKFELRDGVWYDTAYTGQDKKDIKRGSDKYNRLDAGLRTIAEQIGGTVVVLWNGQAYKIK